MSKQIVAIENTGGTAKMIVKDGDVFSQIQLPYGILHIEPIEVKNEKDINKILGKKTHRACVNGEWTQPKYTTIITKRDEHGRTNIIKQGEPTTSEHKHLY